VSHAFSFLFYGAAAKFRRGASLFHTRRRKKRAALSDPLHYGREDGATAAWRAFQATKLYDAIAAAPLIAWYGLSAAHMLPALAATIREAELATLDLHFIASALAQLGAIALIVTALVFLLLRQPPKARAKGFFPRFAAFAGTYLGIAFVWLPPQPLGTLTSFASLALMLAGVGFAVYALLHLGRSFSLMAEARRLVTDGPYAYIRHPLYLGEAAAMLGLMLQFVSPLAVCIAAIQLAFQLERMKNEEQILTDMFPEYSAYMQRTARLLPGVH
jgi:protein-S-isoprenylcysteine O-methyltransferase Ste14